MNESTVAMFGRRNGKTLAPTFLVIATILLGGYIYYMYRELNSKYETSESKLGLYMKRQMSLKSQLQVVYEHRSKLEAVVIKQRQEHQLTKQNFLKKVKECTANLTRAKQEAFNRFNALDTEHQKLKAVHDEVATDFSRLQQQYVRLSEDHRKIIAGHKEDYETLKSMKERESKSLQDRVQSLYSDYEICRADVTKYNGYYQSERAERLKLQDKVENYKKKIREEGEQLATVRKEKEDFKMKLEKCQKRIKELENNIDEVKGKKEDAQKIATTPVTAQAPITTPAKHVVEKIDPPSQEIPSAGHVVKNDKKSSISKPSDKVKKLLIGKEDPDGTLSRKEDSIKDQFEEGAPQEQGDSKAALDKENGEDKKEDSLIDQYEEGGAERSTPKPDTNQEENAAQDRDNGVVPTRKTKGEVNKEVNFQQLVKKSMIVDASEKEEGDEASKRGEAHRRYGQRKGGQRIGRNEDAKKSGGDPVLRLHEYHNRESQNRPEAAKEGAEKGHNSESDDKRERPKLLQDQLDVPVVEEGRSVLEKDEEDREVPHNQFQLARMNGVRKKIEEEDDDLESKYNRKHIKSGVIKKKSKILKKHEVERRNSRDNAEHDAGKDDEEDRSEKKSDSIPLKRAELADGDANDGDRENHVARSNQNTNHVMKVTEPITIKPRSDEKGTKRGIPHRNGGTEEETADKTKEDNGDSFLKKQQRLMHRPIAKRKDKHRRGDDGGKLSEFQSVRSEGDTQQRRRAEGDVIVKSGHDSARGRHQLAPPHVQDKKTMKGNSRNADMKENEDFVQENLDEIPEMKEKKQENKQLNQLHAPIKKPQRNIPKADDAKSNEEGTMQETEDQDNQPDKDSDGQGVAPLSHTHEDDENGDQDLDKGKLNGENGQGDADPEDESRTNNMEIETEAGKNREDIRR